MEHLPLFFYTLNEYGQGFITHSPDERKQGTPRPITWIAGDYEVLKTIVVLNFVQMVDDYFVPVL